MSWAFPPCCCLTRARSKPKLLVRCQRVACSRSFPNFFRLPN